MASPSTGRPHRRSELSAIQQLVAVPVVCAALRSSGVLDRLFEAPATIDELATELEADREGLGRLLVVAQRLGIVDCHGRTWSTPVTHQLLAHLDRSWQSLESVLHGGHRDLRSDDADQAGAVYRSLVGSLPDVYGDAAERLVEALDPITGRVLDVGAGVAPWSTAMLGAWPATTATLLDLPAVVDVTARTVAELGLTERVEVVGADLWSTDFGAEFDLIVVANVCHLFDASRVASLLARLVRWLRPGGRLVVIDAGVSEGDLDAALHDLSLWLRSGGGHRDTTTHLRWLIDLGLSGATTLDLGHDNLVAVTATLEDQT